jgi:thiol-disulfide isomerase/thioredoxin
MMLLWWLAILATSANGPSANADYDDPPPLRSARSQFIILDPPMLLPLVSLERAIEGSVPLAGYGGKVVLLNFWATWCAPCVAELPSLDRLQAEMSSKGIEVVAVSVDDADVDRVVPFLGALGIRHLTPFVDPLHRIAYFSTDGADIAPFALYALPISYVIDPTGRVRGYMPGSAAWDSDEARALLRYYQE